MSAGPTFPVPAGSKPPPSFLRQNDRRPPRQPKVYAAHVSGSEDGDDTAVEDDYVARTLAREKPLPPITWQNWYKEINVVSTVVLTVVPILSVYGAFTTQLTWQTFVWCVVYYFFTGLGITAGKSSLAPLSSCPSTGR